MWKCTGKAPCRHPKETSSAPPAHTLPLTHTRTRVLGQLALRRYRPVRFAFLRPLPPGGPAPLLRLIHARECGQCANVESQSALPSLVALCPPWDIHQPPAIRTCTPPPYCPHVCCCLPPIPPTWGGLLCPLRGRSYRALIMASLLSPAKGRRPKHSTYSSTPSACTAARHDQADEVERAMMTPQG